MCYPFPCMTWSYLMYDPQRLWVKYYEWSHLRKKSPGLRRWRLKIDMMSTPASIGPESSSLDWTCPKLKKDTWPNLQVSSYLWLSLIFVFYTANNPLKTDSRDLPRKKQQCINRQIWSSTNRHHFSRCVSQYALFYRPVPPVPKKSRVLLQQKLQPGMLQPGHSVRISRWRWLLQRRWRQLQSLPAPTPSQQDSGSFEHFQTLAEWPELVRVEPSVKWGLGRPTRRVGQSGKLGCRCDNWLDFFSLQYVSVKVLLIRVSRTQILYP